MPHTPMGDASRKAGELYYDTVLRLGLGETANEAMDAIIAEREREASIAAAPEMLAMLVELEWVGSREPMIDSDGNPVSFGTCVCCLAQGRIEDTQHAPDCRLAALLKRARGEE